MAGGDHDVELAIGRAPLANTGVPAPRTAGVSKPWPVLVVGWPRRTVQIVGMQPVAPRTTGARLRFEGRAAPTSSSLIILYRLLRLRGAPTAGIPRPGGGQGVPPGPSTRTQSMFRPLTAGAAIRPATATARQGEHQPPSGLAGVEERVRGRLAAAATRGWVGPAVQRLFPEDGPASQLGLLFHDRRKPA